MGPRGAHERGRWVQSGPMPDPRIRRSKPRVPRAGQPRAAAPDVATPDVEAQDAVGAPASLAPADAASAEAEAELEAAASVAATAAGAADSGPDTETTPDDPAAPDPEPDAAAADDVDAESAGWFRDEPLAEDGSASGDVTEVVPEEDGEAGPERLGLSRTSSPLSASAIGPS